MNILQILSSPSAGGAEVYVRDLTLAMKTAGHTVYIGFLGHATDVGRSPDYERKFLDCLEDHQIPYFFIGNECRRSPWKGVSRVRRFVIDHAIDVYHTHLIYGIIFAAGVPVPRVYTHHTIQPRSGWLGYSIYNRLVDQYVGISKVCADRLRKYTRRSVTMILNGADASKFRIDAPKNQQSKKLVECIAVGRCTEQKNYSLMIEALALLPQNLRSKVHLSICGEGVPQVTSQLAQMVQYHGLQNQISFLGNRNDVPDLLALSDLMLMSSSWEGLPIALIEASLAGLACIVTDVGGCSEVIDTCKNGIVVPAGDAAAFASAISTLVVDSETREQMRQSARKRSQVFAIETACKQHLELYSSLVQE